ncbi:ABC transporter permease [Gorillibacterium timonense]|uniref:ABC transporter permease n=1 Tax=Gorillibacterium timonense TaxID=1689269 RepID=UPI00071C914D|nr:ABC-2 family transporter protein [Gorillibacterium timonense]
MGKAKKYLSIAGKSVQNTISYRLSYFMNLFAGWIGLFSMYYLWKAIYSGRSELAGFTWEEMKAYLVVTFIANSLLSYYSETRISSKILDGSVAIDLLKPIDFQKARFAETLGSCLIEGAVGAVLVGILGLAVIDVRLSMDWQTGGLLMISLACSLLVKFGIVYLTALLCFWTTGSLGLVWARQAVTNLLSGALVPLAFFPTGLERFALVLPFQSIVHTPASLALGNLSGAAALEMVGLQLFWAIFLWFAGKLLWSRAVRQITIHGG